MYRFRENFEIVPMLLGGGEHVRGGRLPRKKQDLASRVFPSEFNRKVDSSHPRHDHICDKKIGYQSAGCGFQCPIRVVEGVRRKARLVEDHRQSFCDKYLIVDDKYNPPAALHFVTSSFVFVEHKVVRVE